MQGSWDGRIDRARQLAARDDAASPLLLFYSQVLALQRNCYHALQRSDSPLSGSLGRDVEAVVGCVPHFLRAIAQIGPPPLAEEARRILNLDEAAIKSMLLEAWRTPSDRHFFSKAILQPYAELLAEVRIAPVDRGLEHAENVCPFCGGAPQLSVLRSPGDADGGSRMLLCATCFTLWPFRRVLCAHCGEEDEKRLEYYHSPAFDHLRVDACETCKFYLKTVDLTRLGLAVPVVDEVAGAPLDVWAKEHGYEKIELNLVGL